MGRFIAACRAFWQVLLGAELVPKPRKEEGAGAKTLPDRFAEGAVYTLLLLQREGRLIDFLMETIDNYSDAQIGAAVRQIHAGSAPVLKEHFALAPVLGEEEGKPVTVPDPLDATRIRLTGNVPDSGPYQGTLSHKGWHAANTSFPTRTGEFDPMVVQPAEVEI